MIVFVEYGIDGGRVTVIGVRLREGGKSFGLGIGSGIYEVGVWVRVGGIGNVFFIFCTWVGIVSV